jgi:8-oxo-dGTP pyrophosphatase MutT (NUDIX family)
MSSVFAMEKPLTLFYDRRGNSVSRHAHSIVKPRRGVFAMAVAGNAVALVWQKVANGVPELPGGGIENGETPDDALRREWDEETGLPFDLEGPIGNEFRHVRGFYADDKNEFWIYDQIFRLYFYTGEASIGTKWLNSEGDYASWENIDSLSTLPVNRAHWCAIPSLLSQISIRK